LTPEILTLQYRRNHLTMTKEHEYLLQVEGEPEYDDYDDEEERRRTEEEEAEESDEAANPDENEEDEEETY